MGSVMLFAAEDGIVPAGDRAAMTDVAGRLAVIEVPDAGHAIMLDQPLALLTGIHGVLAGWTQRPSAE